MFVQKLHDLRKVFFGEVLRPHAGVKTWQAKEHGVRAGRHGSAQTIPIPGRGQKLWMISH